MRRIWCLFVLLIFSLAFFPARAFGEEPLIRADAAILMDYDTGQVYFEKKGWDKMHPASTTKIMTTLIALEMGNLSDVVTVSPEAGRVDRGSSLNLRQGDKLTLGNLIKAALMLSANDSTVAIGQHMAGDADLYVKMMNSKALSIGALQTNYVNTNGFTKPSHLTTAYDLALIARYALHNPRFASIVRTQRSEVKWLEPEKERPVNNTNKLLWMYPGTIGVKTGTTSAAGGCLVAAVEKNGRTLISVVLRSSRRYHDTIKILDYGFNEVKQVKLVREGQVIGEAGVIEGKTAKVEGIAAKTYSVSIPTDRAKEFKTTVYLPKKLQAPVKKGQRIGTITVLHKGWVAERVPIIASEEVKRKNFIQRLFD